MARRASTKASRRLVAKATARAIIPIAAGVACDRIVGDPQRWHPVAGFGRYALVLERVMYRDSRLAGAVYVGACVVPWTLATMAAATAAPTLTTAAVLWASLGGTTLEKVGTRLADDLEAGRIDAARLWIPWMCSRDPQLLDTAGMARAATESLAENTSDAAVVPLILASIGRPELVAAHRMINTLDAMVGYHNERYENFGWAAAKLDDAVAYIPARVTGLIHIALAARSGRARSAWTAWRTQAPGHPSPNAGVVESTAAGALGVQLGGPTVYAHGIEQRPVLGTGSAPTTSDVRAAVRLSRAAQYCAAGLAACTRAAWTIVAMRRRGRPASLR